MSEGAFSIDQLMELAGLSVSQAGKLSTDMQIVLDSDIKQVYKVLPPSEGKNILVACGPGNNGKLAQS